MSGRFAIRVIIICSLYAILYYAYNHFSLAGSFSFLEIDWVVFTYLICFINFAGITGSWLLFRFRSGTDSHKRTPNHFMIIGAVSVSWIILMSALCGWLFKYQFLQNITVNEIRETYPGFIAQGLVIGILSAIVFAVVDHSLGSYNRLRNSQLEVQQMKTQQLNLRFETLRNQISPHFLFNSLNTISSLIYRDTCLAEKFIRNLASVYHSVLENYEHPVISLERELALVEHYSYLMQVRFEDAFSLDILSPDNPEKYCVPPLSLQMLVENAIKHNQLSQETPLRVRVFAEGDTLVVTNNFIGNPVHVRIGKDLYQKPDKGRPQGVGLRNIQNRYRLIKDTPITITKDEDFTVRLPLITMDEAKVIHN